MLRLFTDRKGFGVSLLSVCVEHVREKVLDIDNLQTLGVLQNFVSPEVQISSGGFFIFLSWYLLTDCFHPPTVCNAISKE